MPHHFPQTDANRNVGKNQHGHCKQEAGVGRDVVRERNLHSAKGEALKDAQDE
jgi:hypothetical protein